MVRWASIVLVVAAELCVQGLLLLAHRVMPVLFAPGGDAFQPSAEPLVNRLHMHGELPLPAAGAYVREAEKVEGVGLFLAPLLRLPLCKSPKRHQPCLLRVQGQTEFGEPIFGKTSSTFSASSLY